MVCIITFEGISHLLNHLQVKKYKLLHRLPTLDIIGIKGATDDISNRIGSKEIIAPPITRLSTWLPKK